MRLVGLDPSTKTGFCALDESGNVLRAKELTGIGPADPKRMVTLIDEIMAHVQPDDVICIEGLPFASPQAIQMGAIGWGIRMALFRRGIAYYDVAPMALKKFCGATGNKGPDGKAIKADKIEVAKQVLKRWNFESGSDNVTDAFVLARVAKGLTDGMLLSEQLTSFQLEVIKSILNPPEKKKRKKVTK